jgi:hypothetical protein
MRAGNPKLQIPNPNKIPIGIKPKADLTKENEGNEGGAGRIMVVRILTDHGRKSLLRALTRYV